MIGRVFLDCRGSSHDRLAIGYGCEALNLSLVVTQVGALVGRISVVGVGRTLGGEEGRFDIFVTVDVDDD